MKENEHQSIINIPILHLDEYLTRSLLLTATTNPFRSNHRCCLSIICTRFE
jgi:hypothetical protein